MNPVAGDFSCLLPKEKRDVPPIHFYPILDYLNRGQERMLRRTCKAIYAAVLAYRKHGIADRLGPIAKLSLNPQKSEIWDHKSGSYPPQFSAAKTFDEVEKIASELLSRQLSLFKESDQTALNKHSPIMARLVSVSNHSFFEDAISAGFLRLADRIFCESELSLVYYWSKCEKKIASFIKMVDPIEAIHLAALLNPEQQFNSYQKIIDACPTDHLHCLLHQEWFSNVNQAMLYRALVSRLWKGSGFDRVLKLMEIIDNWNMRAVYLGEGQMNCSQHISIVKQGLARRRCDCYVAFLGQFYDLGRIEEVENAIFNGDYNQEYRVAYLTFLLGKRDFRFRGPTNSIIFDAFLKVVDSYHKSGELDALLKYCEEIASDLMPYIRDHCALVVEDAEKAVALAKQGADSSVLVKACMKFNRVDEAWEAFKAIYDTPYVLKWDVICFLIGKGEFARAQLVINTLDYNQPEGQKMLDKARKKRKRSV